jgi:hypothetical protein
LGDTVVGAITNIERIERKKLFKEGLKRCPKCKKNKTLSEFFNKKSSYDGLDYKCKVCSRQACKRYNDSEEGKRKSKQWKDSDKGKRSVREYRKSNRYKETRMKHRNKYPYRHWAANTLSQHRIRGNEIKITTDELEILASKTTHCKFCDRKLSWGFGNGLTAASPTLDRINNGNTLSADSIQILCRNCNASKQDKTMEELISWCETIISKFKKPKTTIKRK